jgi:hypothetical protein
LAAFGAVQGRFFRSGRDFMRIRRRLPIPLAVLLVAAAVALVVVLRKHAPPEPARLLPGADGFFYINLKWIRRIDFAGQLPPVPHDPEYEQFIQATGFQFERDLDQAAFAIHYPTSLSEAQIGSPRAPRFSEVFIGRIDGVKLRDYLHKISSLTESDGSVDIYEIPLEGRTLRVAILGPDTIAASNHPDPQVIRGIIERSRKLASPFGGPQLLRQYYKHVPLASLAWAIFKVDPSLASPPVTDLSLLFSKPAAMVVSARYLGAVHLRAEAYTGSDDEAKHVAGQLGTFLDVFHRAENAVSTPPSDADVKQFFDSLNVEQHGDRAVLTAIVPPGFIRKAVAEPPKPTTRPATPDQALGK